MNTVPAPFGGPSHDHLDAVVPDEDDLFRRAFATPGAHRRSLPPVRPVTIAAALLSGMLVAGMLAGPPGKGASPAAAVPGSATGNGAGTAGQVLGSADVVSPTRAALGIGPASTGRVGAAPTASGVLTALDLPLQPSGLATSTGSAVPTSGAVANSASAGGAATSPTSTTPVAWSSPAAPAGPRPAGSPPVAAPGPVRTAPGPAAPPAHAPTPQAPAPQAPAPQAPPVTHPAPQPQPPVTPPRPAPHQPFGPPRHVVIPVPVIRFPLPIHFPVRLPVHLPAPGHDGPDRGAFFGEHASNHVDGHGFRR